MEHTERKETGQSVGVVGFGVVGSATAHRLYDLGNRVYVTDLRSPEQLEHWRDYFTFRKPYRIGETDTTFLVLPTPSEEEKLFRSIPAEERAHIPEGNFGFTLDQSAYDPVIDDLGKQLRRHMRHHLFVVRSTVMPGSTRAYGERLQELSGKRMGRDFSMVMIPEFLRAFNSLEDEATQPYLVVGHHDERGLERVRSIYQHQPPGEDGTSKVYPMTLEEAELVKLENNALNALMISLHNGRAALYEDLTRQGMPIDYDRMTRFLTRTTEAFTSSSYGTRAGVFYGGTCLRKDPGALDCWLEDERRINNGFTALLAAAMRENLHLQKRILNAHDIPPTTEASLEALAARDHPTYDNVRKTRQAVEEAKGWKRGAVGARPRTKRVAQG